MKMNTRILILCGLGIAINLVLGTTVLMLKIPLIFMDTIGTIFVAALFGPLAGAATGGLTNVIQGFLTSPQDIPFALVNIAIGLIVGFVSKRFAFDLKTAIVTGLVLSVVAPLIGTPIAVWIYGGLTGGGSDFIVAWLLAAGNSIFTAAFVPRITGNLVDKIASCILVAVLIKSLPASVLGTTLQSLHKSKKAGGAEQSVSN